jgi:metallo-beta-lactamase class B
MSMSRAALAAAMAAWAAGTHAQPAWDPPKVCSQCAAWNVPQEPFRIFGNTYYVGTAELSAILVVDDAGLVLLDGALPQSAPLIAANIETLGFESTDIRLIVNSHTHFDHAGGIAALQRLSGAMVAASLQAAQALRAGKLNADDPQEAIDDNDFPAVEGLRAIDNGETVSVGDIRLTAHTTPGHTPGGTTWSWRSCEGARCVDIVYADSLNPVSADGFRFSGSASTPSIVDIYERSIRAVETLPCDVLLSPHPGFFSMQDKLRRQAAGETDAFVDSNACLAYAGAARTRLEQRIAEEKATP